MIDGEQQAQGEYAPIKGALEVLLEDPAVLQRLDTLGMNPIGGSADDFKRFIESEYEKFGTAIKASNIKAD